MKLFKNISLAGVLCFLAVSCSDYVDFEASENYEIVADVYFQSQDDYQAAVVGVYDPLQWMYMTTLIGDIASDNSLSGGESATDVIGVQEIDQMTHNPNNDNLTSIWKFLYEGINRANYLEENKDKLEFDGKAALYGEVYFLRAMYYFDLVRMFGDVPLLLTNVWMLVLLELWKELLRLKYTLKLRMICKRQLLFYQIQILKRVEQLNRQPMPF